MTDKTVTPSLGTQSFTCPHCGAVAHQTWYHIYLKSYDKGKGPWVPVPDIIDKIKSNRDLESKATLIEHFENMLSKELFKEYHESSDWLDIQLHNLYVSRCYSCDKYAVWVSDGLMYPAQLTEVEPNEDMPDGIRADFLEAASIVDKSPRGAAALLRLCIQKLMLELKLKGRSIDDDIKTLVEKGLDNRIQKALDIVRVVGNNAVHPGQIDLKDDKKIAMELFKLVNLIVEAMIAAPKHVEEMYGDLPPKALEAIEKRDGKKET